MGIGDEDFSQMIVLDADSKVLADKEGKVAARDIIQFVEFQELHEKATVEINEIMMQEVPDQFVDYMVMNQIIPEYNNAGLYEEEASFQDVETVLNNYVTNSGLANEQETSRPLKMD